MQKTEDILKYIKEKDINVLELSRKTNIPSARIYKWLKGKGNPKSEDLEKLKAWKVSILEEVPHEKLTTDVEEALKQNLPGDEITKQILLNLSESHKDLSAAHKELAESNHRLVKNQDMMLSRALATGDGQSGNVQDVERKLRVLQELLIKIGTGKGKTWMSEQEARAEVHNLVNAGEVAV